MTASTSIGREFTIAKLVRMAYHKAGLINPQLSPDAVQTSMACNELELVLEGMAARGVYAHVLTFENVILVAGTTTYQLAATTQDVAGDAMLIPSGDSVTAPASETLCRQVKVGDWHRAAGKSSRGTPTMFYADRRAQRVSVVFWPIPAAAGTARFLVERRIADADDANATLDLHGYWYNYVVYELAKRLAESATLPLARIAQLSSEAEAAFKQGRRKATEDIGVQLSVPRGR